MHATNFHEYARILSHTVDALTATGQTKIVSIQYDQRSMTRGFIVGHLRFDDNSELHFREFIDLTLPDPRIMYAYHYQDAASSVIFRYDNSRHRPPLPQLEHKQTPDGVTVSTAPTLEQVIDEIPRAL